MASRSIAHDPAEPIRARGIIVNYTFKKVKPEQLMVQFCYDI